MEKRGKLGIIFSVVALFLFLILFSTFYFYFRWRWAMTKTRSGDGGGDNSLESGGFKHAEAEVEELLVFSGGEHLRTQNILEAPGEVVGKSSYGTLYRATVLISVTCGGLGGSASSVLLLRFIRPACIGRTGEILAPVRLIGLVRHPNLVPLRALYVGPRGEKLFVHPFYAAGNLAQFLKGGSAETKSWKVICELCLGIARGIEQLHSGLQKPIIHGNLKSKNILLGADLLPRLSDFGLHLLLTPTAAQEMLEASASQGYKAPELIKMKEATRETDIYSLGIVFLEILTRKDASSCRLLVLDSKISDTFRSHLINVRKDQSSNNEELLRCYQLAISCCSPLPAFRPDIKYVIRKLEGIGQS